MTNTEIINMTIDAYIRIMGEDKWNSLTANQQHDAIMIMVADMLKALA